MCLDFLENRQFLPEATGSGYKVVFVLYDSQKRPAGYTGLFCDSAGSPVNGWTPYHYRFGEEVISCPRLIQHPHDCFTYTAGFHLFERIEHAIEFFYGECAQWLLQPPDFGIPAVTRVSYVGVRAKGYVYAFTNGHGICQLPTIVAVRQRVILRDVKYEKDLRAASKEVLMA